VHTEGGVQLVYFDTPGVLPHLEGRKLNMARPLLTEVSRASGFVQRPRGPQRPGRHHPLAAVQTAPRRPAPRGTE